VFVTCHWATALIQAFVSQGIDEALHLRRSDDIQFEVIFHRKIA
jgi:hypothetical protein